MRRSNQGAGPGKVSGFPQCSEPAAALQSISNGGEGPRPFSSYIHCPITGCQLPWEGGVAWWTSFLTGEQFPQWWEAVSYDQPNFPAVKGWRTPVQKHMGAEPQPATLSSWDAWVPSFMIGVN